jgi:hypothetical protein
VDAEGHLSVTLVSSHRDIAWRSGVGLIVWSTSRRPDPKPAEATSWTPLSALQIRRDTARVGPSAVAGGLVDRGSPLVAVFAPRLAGGAGESGRVEHLGDLCHLQHLCVAVYPPI